MTKKINHKYWKKMINPNLKEQINNSLSDYKFYKSMIQRERCIWIKIQNEIVQEPKKYIVKLFIFHPPDNIFNQDIFCHVQNKKLGRHLEHIIRTNQDANIIFQMIINKNYEYFYTFINHRTVDRKYVYKFLDPILNIFPEQVLDFYDNGCAEIFRNFFLETHGMSHKIFSQLCKRKDFLNSEVMEIVIGRYSAKYVRSMVQNGYKIDSEFNYLLDESRKFRFIRFLYRKPIKHRDLKNKLIDRLPFFRYYKNTYYQN
jgi:hypothetical protein